MIPAAFSPRPWHRLPKVAALYDRDGKLVSFVQNGEFLIAIERVHDGLVASLGEMTAAYELAATMLGMPPEEVACNVAGARDLLKRCAPEKWAAAAEMALNVEAARVPLARRAVKVLPITNPEPPAA